LTGQSEARFVREGDWLVVRLSGPCSLEWFLKVIEDIGKAMRTTPAAALLVDTLAAFGTVGDLDRYRFGMATVEQQLTGPIAFVGKEPILDPRRLGEVVARNRGVNVRAFTSEPEARVWLREQTGVRPQT